MSHVEKELIIPLKQLLVALCVQRANTVPTLIDQGQMKIFPAFFVREIPRHLQVLHGNSTVFARRDILGRMVRIVPRVCLVITRTDMARMLAHIV